MFILLGTLINKYDFNRRECQGCQERQLLRIPILAFWRLNFCLFKV